MKNYKHYSSKQLSRRLRVLNDERNEITKILISRKKSKTPKKKQKETGVIDTIFSLIKDNAPISNIEVWEKLIEKFPERNPESMYNTVKLCLMTKKRPVYMERKRNIEFEITERDNQIKEFSIKNFNKKW